MMDDRLDDQLRDAARDYNEPPETPREEMWAAIQAERAGIKEAETAENDLSVLPIRRFRRFPGGPLAWGAGIAALLALGIGLGLLSYPGPGATPAPLPVAALPP